MRLLMTSQSLKVTFSIFLMAIFANFQPVHAKESVDDFLDLELEDLLSMEVTSVSKKKQRITDAPAAIFVITQEDIRRSGVTSIPEALRMAPGLQVARIDSNKWAISSRGFNGQFANKLLVLMDGRSVYTPSFSGVYWDMQDTLMEDIDRIEVIRGPGATLWGANAVNGVINIITKFAGDTEGGLLTAGGGEEEKGFVSFRYGLEFDEETHARFYAKAFERDSYVLEADGGDAGDAWESLRTGFRLDSASGDNNSWTLQGDIYDTENKQTIGSLWLDPALIDPASFAPFPPAGTIIPTLQLGVADLIENTGWNLLGRWNHTINEHSSTSLQLYYDNTERKETYITQTHNTFDIDFQHNLTLSENQELIWGLGYRQIEDEFNNSFAASLIPDRQTLDLYSAFIQDRIELAVDRFFLTIGSKFEDNEYTGTEIQPSIKGLWKPDDKSSLWGSVSRAVRTPARIERTGRFTTFSGVVTTGNPLFPVAPVRGLINGVDNFDSEETLSYELGYRIQPRENLSFDVAVFYNEYDNLLSYELIDPSTREFGNNTSGDVSGLEVALDWRTTPWWRMQASYSTLNISLKHDTDGNTKATATSIGEGSSPQHQFSLRSTTDLNANWELDFWVYFVDKLDVASATALINGTKIESYTSLNARVGWHPSENLEFSVALLNLQGGEHTEFVGEYFNELSEVERTVYAKLRWDF